MDIVYFERLYLEKHGIGPLIHHWEPFYNRLNAVFLSSQSSSGIHEMIFQGEVQNFLSEV